MASFLVASQRGRRSGFGWLGQRVISKALSSASGGRGGTSSNGPFKLPSNVHPAVEAKAKSREASQRDAPFLKEMLPSREFEGASCLCPRDMSERSFSFYRILQG